MLSLQQKYCYLLWLKIKIQTYQQQKLSHPICGSLWIRHDFFSHWLTFFAAFFFSFSFFAADKNRTLNKHFSSWWLHPCFPAPGKACCCLMFIAKDDTSSCTCSSCSQTCAFHACIPHNSQNAHTLLQCRGLNERKRGGGEGGVNDLASPLSEYFISHHLQWWWWEGRGQSKWSGWSIWIFYLSSPTMMMG